MDEVWDNIDWEWHYHSQPDKRALVRATELLKATKEADVFPETASSGKFPTIRLFWQDARVEVEVFCDSYELYVLPKADKDEMFSIVEFDAASSDTLPRVVEKISEAVSESND